MAETIGGTVIQRSFVGRGISNVIHVASVPLDELGSANAELQDLLAEILGVPSASVLRKEDYARVVERLGEIPRSRLRQIGTAYGAEEELFRLASLTGEIDNQGFLGDFVTLISRPTSAVAVAATYGSLELVGERSFQALDLNEDALDVALSCVSSRFRPRRSVDAFYKEMLSYDIPVGQSPQARGDSLLTLLETSKKFCIGPLALGGTQAVSQLSQGNYVGALLTTGTASVMTLVLIGTVSVGSLIVQRVAQARSKIGTRIRQETD